MSRPMGVTLCLSVSLEVRSRNLKLSMSGDQMTKKNLLRLLRRDPPLVLGLHKQEAKLGLPLHPIATARLVMTARQTLDRIEESRPTICTVLSLVGFMADRHT